ncbi:hypothetical protein KJ603_02570 [Patescibacteria group bacterium]|nr:hypothetical protein [Patescibacteria group bacterium]
MKNKEKFSKILLLFSLFILGCLIVIFTEVNYFLNILIVYLPATALTLYWAKNSRGKIIAFALLATLFFAIPIEIIARLANAWDVQSILPRIDNLAPLENIFYAFLNMLWPLAFYEKFVDKDKKQKISHRGKYLFLMFLIFSAITYSFYFINKEIITLDYWQIGIIFLLIPAILIFSHNIKLLKKTILPLVFFAIIFLIHELISLYLGHWWWPGNYLLPIELFGKTFPLDDVIIWYVLSTPMLIGGYELFWDDFK